MSARVATESAEARFGSHAPLTRFPAAAIALPLASPVLRECPKTKKAPERVHFKHLILRINFVVGAVFERATFRFWAVTPASSPEFSNETGASRGQETFYFVECRLWVDSGRSAGRAQTKGANVRSENRTFRKQSWRCPRKYRRETSRSKPPKKPCSVPRPASALQGTDMSREFLERLITELDCTKADARVALCFGWMQLTQCNHGFAVALFI